MRFVLAVAALGFLIGTPQVGNAGVMNGSFEASGGSYDDWDTIGLATIEGALAGGPTDGSFQSLTSNASGAVGLSALDDFLFGAGSTTTLGDLVPGGVVSNGSAIKQTITASIGDELTFDWNFLTQEVIVTPGGGITGAADDFAFWTLSDGANILASALTPGIFGTTTAASFTAETGFASSGPHVFTSAGSFTLAFGVVNEGGTLLDSALLIDNVVLSSNVTNPVPEPTSFATWGLMVGAVAAVRRRRK